jgi:uncharacterized LabA/DUF88 family protein
MRSKRVAILIDGGHLRVKARQARKSYDPEYIEKIAHACLAADEDLLRVLYYDCAPYQGEVVLPVSGKRKSFTKPDDWLNQLSQKDLFAVRRGVLKFRGWVPKKILTTPRQLDDADFQPAFEQKGVDMRIGLDVATYAAGQLVDRLILVSGDTDCVPAMKQARKYGVQLVLVTFPGVGVSGDLLAHTDFRRELVWP